MAGLREVPELNATLDGDEIVFWERYDLGIAVQTDEAWSCRSCATPTTKSLDELDAEARRLAEGARAGTLKPEELRGSTFTVTSAGRLGGLFATPLVNYPEVGILGLHRIADRGRPFATAQIVVRVDRLALVHLRPPRGRRRAGVGVPARGGRPPRESRIGTKRRQPAQEPRWPGAARSSARSAAS